jgi:hypothetical protein
MSAFFVSSFFLHSTEFLFPDASYLTESAEYLFLSRCALCKRYRRAGHPFDFPQGREALERRARHPREARKPSFSRRRESRFENFSLPCTFTVCRAPCIPLPCTVRLPAVHVAGRVPCTINILLFLLPCLPQIPPWSALQRSTRLSGRPSRFPAPHKRKTKRSSSPP